MIKDLEVDKVSKPKIFVVGGLLYGDEGKGTTVEYLANRLGEKCKLIVRYNGGHQAAHHVVSDLGMWHCFSQFGSASFEKHTFTLLSKYTLVSPTSLIAELDTLKSKKCEKIENRIFIDKECFIVTPYHKLINRATELLLNENKNGSTGQGVGNCLEDIYKSCPDFFPLGDIINKLDKNYESMTPFNSCLQIKHLSLPKITLTKLINDIKVEKLKEFKELQTMLTEKISNEKVKAELINKSNKLSFDIISSNPEDKIVDYYINFYERFSKNFCDGSEIIYEQLKSKNSIVFEGAHGALLDKIFGFYPHLTKSICTDINAKKLLEIVQEKYKYSYKNDYDYIKLGVLRCYSSRHGEGPFVSFSEEVTEIIPESHNLSTDYQGKFKLGHFDFLAAKYGISIFNPDYLVITCFDKYFHYFSENKCTLIYKYLIDKEKITSKENFELLFKSCQSKEEENKLEIHEIVKKDIGDHFKNNFLTEILNKASKVEEINEFSYDLDVEKVVGLELNNCLETLIRTSSLEKLNFVDSLDSIAEQIVYFISLIEKELNKKVAIISLGPSKVNKIADEELIFK